MSSSLRDPSGIYPTTLLVLILLSFSYSTLTRMPTSSSDSSSSFLNLSSFLLLSVNYLVLSSVVLFTTQTAYMYARAFLVGCEQDNSPSLLRRALDDRNFPSNGCSHRTTTMDSPHAIVGVTMGTYNTFLILRFVV